MANIVLSQRNQDHLHQVVVQRKRVNKGIHLLFLVCAVLIILIICGVFLFVGINGIQMFVLAPRSFDFLSSTIWDPHGYSTGIPRYGMLGFILGSVVTTLLAVLIATPLSFAMALYMTEACPHWLANVLRPLLEIFTGMPSVVLGFLALITVVPWLTVVAGPLATIPPVAGFGWTAAIIVLTIMILPTIVSISIDALVAVPESVREASLALGSSRWQMMKNAVLPAAATGLATAVVLGMARAIGEALAVSLVLKGTTLPQGESLVQFFFGPNVNMTQPIVLNFSEALGAERAAYFMLGFLLLIISFLFVCVSRYIASRSVYQ